MHAHIDQLPDSISELVDAPSLSRSFRQHPDEVVASLKQAVKTVNEGLKQAYRSGAVVEDIVYGRARLIDRLLIASFNHVFADISQDISLIAVGGYGRGELHPGSDIDLMLLLKDKENDATRTALEKYLMLLWDSRLEIGHSVRTLDECISESANDITVATNIMEARLLTGNEPLFEEMMQLTGPEKIWDDQSYFQAKLDEQVKRSGKFNDTAYGLEPNIKESRGGLRDIQMIGWVAKRHFGASDMQGLVEKDFLQQDELDTLLKGQHLLWRIRCSLHYLAGRREDRLLFDYQRDLAHEFGFANDDNNRNNQAIEQFMQQYYRTVMQLERLNEMLLQHFREAILYANIPGEPEIINEAFQVENGYIEVRYENVFTERPTVLLEIFHIMQQHPDIQGVRAETIRLIRKYRYLIDDEFRASTRARKIFMKIMKHSRGVTHELRRMNRYGILAAYIPAFDSIVGRMQYDLFHAYTVDQHTLFVLRNQRRLSVPEFCHELPLASGIFHHIKKPHLLYLAGLFHDIAKGRQGDHSILGAEDALEFCINHGLHSDDAELVSWLVRNHLVMSMTAQRKDISDPLIIKDFAEQMRTLPNLDYLYLLTISDIRGTNPEQWNSWKDKLLSELYNKTAALLHIGLEAQTDKLENIKQNQTDALRILEIKGVSSHRVHSIWNNFTDEYFLRNTPGEIVWHTHFLFQSTNTTEPLVKTRIDNQTESLELLVYMKSRDHIFAQIVSVIGQMSLDVASAQIVNCKNGYALETFKIISDNYSIDALEYGSVELVQKLSDILSREDTPIMAAASNISRAHKYFHAPTLIDFENVDNDRTTRMHIDTIDRPGVLADIAKTLIESNVRLLGAKISTAGEKAVDYFDITDPDSGSILAADKQQDLKSRLLEKF